MVRMVRMVDGKPKPFGEDKPPKGRAALLVAAVVGAAAAGGTALSAGGGAASIESGGGSSLQARNSGKDSGELADRDGSGNIYALPDALLKRAGVRFTGEHYESRLDGALLVIAEATSGGGHPDPAVLDDAADVAAEFPAP